MKSILNTPPAHETPFVFKHVYSREDNYARKRKAGSDGMYAEGTLALTLRLCRFAFMAPLRVSDERAGRRAGYRFHVSTLMAVLQAVAMTVVNLITLTSIILELYLGQEEQVHAEGATLQTFVWLVDVALIQVIASLAAYGGLVQMENLRRVLEQLHQIKLELSVEGPSVRMESIKSVAMITMLLWIVLIMSVEYVYFDRQARSKGEAMRTINIFYGMIYFIDFQGMLAALKWACTVLAVREGAATINHHLKRLLNGSDFLSLPKKGSAIKPEMLVKRLALSYQRISDVIRQLNDTNGLLLMILILSTFLRFVNTPYYMLFQENVFGVPISLNWMLIHLIALTLTIEPCHWTHSQREHTAILLGELIMQQTSNLQRFSTELDQFAKLLMLDSTKFSILGVYTLDRQLTAAVFGGVTTYLVIVIQLKSTSDT